MFSTFIHELSEHTQVHAMLTSTTASHGRGNLRGSRSSAASSSSAAAATLEEDEHEFNDTPPPESQILKYINLNDLEQRAEQHSTHRMLEITCNLKEGIHTTDAEGLCKEPFKIQNALTEINQSNTKTINKNKTPQAREDLA